ncbi:MAG: hypothetical protein ABSG51_16780 [Terracidiphilus sp.]
MKLLTALLSLLILQTACCVAPVFASTSKPINLLKLSPNTPQGLEGGYWKTEGNFDPILRFKNILLKQPLDVTPSLFFADGAEYRLPVVHLEPAGVAEVNVRYAIQDAPASLRKHISTFGMAGVSYHWA